MDVIYNVFKFYLKYNYLSFISFFETFNFFAKMFEKVLNDHKS